MRKNIQSRNPGKNGENSTLVIAAFKSMTSGVVGLVTAVSNQPVEYETSGMNCAAGSIQPFRMFFRGIKINWFSVISNVWVARPVLGD